MSGTPTAAQSAFGSLLQLYDVNGANPTTIGGITDISVTFKQNTADASTMVSPNGWMEKIGLMKDLGSISCTIQWLPNDVSGLQQQLQNALRGNTLCKFNILYPGTPTRTITFYALVGSIGVPLKYNSIMTATLSLDGSGEPIFS